MNVDRIVRLAEEEKTMIRRESWMMALLGLVSAIYGFVAAAYLFNTDRWIVGVIWIVGSLVWVAVIKMRTESIWRRAIIWYIGAPPR